MKNPPTQSSVSTKNMTPTPENESESADEHISLKKYQNKNKKQVIVLDTFSVVVFKICFL